MSQKTPKSQSTGRPKRLSKNELYNNHGIVILKNQYPDYHYEGPDDGFYSLGYRKYQLRYGGNVYSFESNMSNAIKQVKMKDKMSAEITWVEKNDVGLIKEITPRVQSPPPSIYKKQAAYDNDSFEGRGSGGKVKKTIKRKPTTP